MTPPRDRPSYRDLPVPPEAREQSACDECAEHGYIEGRLLAVEGNVGELVRLVGHGADHAEHVEGTGLAGVVERLDRTIGRAPNDATGDKGSGLCRVLAELAREQRTQSRGVARAVAVGSAGSLSLGVLVIELLHRLGVF